MLYGGAPASLCVLEVLVHGALLPTDMIVVQARIPNGLLEQSNAFQENPGPRNELDKERSYRGPVCALGSCSE